MLRLQQKLLQDENLGSGDAPDLMNQACVPSIIILNPKVIGVEERHSCVGFRFNYIDFTR